MCVRISACGCVEKRTAAERKTALTLKDLQADVVNPDEIEICDGWLLEAFRGLFSCNDVKRLKVKCVARETRIKTSES